MSQRLSFWTEKLTVQVMIVVLLATWYFLLYPLIWSGEGCTAVTFLAVGGVIHTVAFVMGLLVLAAVCGILTVTVRPSGAILTMLLGAGTMAARSPMFRTLLWLRQDGFNNLFGMLIIETVVLGGVTAAAVLVLAWVRTLAVRAVPRWAWRPFEHPTADHGSEQAARLTAGLGPWGRSLVSTTLVVLVGLAIVTVLLQSSRRGQVLFALLASFAVAGWLAHRLLPAPHIEAYLLAPFVAAVLLYALALVGAYGAGPQAWMAVPLHARVLPVDWLTAGGGGVMLGCWIAQRMDDAKLLDELEEERKGSDHD